MSRKKQKTNLTRRNFIKGAAVGAGAIAVTGLGSTGLSAAPPPKKWDQATDVVIMGAGGAGLMAAIEAKNSKASVTVLEKAPTVRLNATNICGGGFAAAGTKIQQKMGIKDTPDLFYADLMAYGLNQNTPELARLVADKSGETFEILSGWGLEAEPMYFGGHSVHRFHRNKSATGKEYLDVLLKVAEERGISITYNTAVTKLFVDPLTDRVLGVETNKKQSIMARKAVVLATGGYAGNPSLIDGYMPKLIGAMSGAAPVSTGEGLQMAMKIGADISHIDGAGYYPAGFAGKDRRGGYFRWYNFTASGGIIVNKKGMRFVNEDTSSTYMTDELVKQPDGIMYTIADEAIWEKALALKVPPVIGYTSDKFREEVGKGTVKKGETIEALGTAAGVDGEALKKTIEKYNGYVNSAADPEFSRKKEQLSSKIEKAPFYAIPSMAVVMLCTGGLRVNTKAQVVDPYRKPIPGLYAAGEVACGPQGAYYLGGGNIAWTFVSGHIAGANAAKEQPRK